MAVKTLVHPVTGKTVKLGRNRPLTAHGRSSFGKMLQAGVLPQVTVPANTYYSGKAAQSLHDIYMNDQLGDCVIAGSYHVRGVTSFNSGAGVMFSDQQVIQAYSAIGGYNPNAPLVNGQNPTDNGCDENQAINYFENTGFPDGVKLVNAVSVDATNIAEVRLALYLFENLLFGVELPDAWITPFPSAPGFRWDKAGAPDPENGHCYIACDLVPKGVKICSWGMCGYTTNAAISYYAAPAQGGQLFTLLSPDTVSKVAQKSPAGFNIGQLQDYINDL